MPPEYTMLIGPPTKGYKSSTLVLITRRHRSKWWELVCFGPKRHYAKDGTCAHTDAALEQLNPARVRRELVRVVPFGDKPESSKEQERRP